MGEKFFKKFIFFIYFIDDIIISVKIRIIDGQARIIHLCLAIDFLRV